MNIQELIDDLRRRAASCDEAANNYDRRHDSLAAERCRAKAQAYLHSADLTQQAGDDIEVRIGFLQRDVEYWRMRCPVTEHDVTERGVTGEQAATWMDANGFERAYPHRQHVPPKAAMIAYLCETAGVRVGKPAQRVLDEMAAIVPEAKP